MPGGHRPPPAPRRPLLACRHPLLAGRSSQAATRRPPTPTSPGCPLPSHPSRQHYSGCPSRLSTILSSSRPYPVPICFVVDLCFSLWLTMVRFVRFRFMLCRKEGTWRIECGPVFCVAWYIPLRCIETTADTKRSFVLSSPAF